MNIIRRMVAENAMEKNAHMGIYAQLHHKATQCMEQQRVDRRRL
jgi:hypothetical protein